MSGQAILAGVPFLVLGAAIVIVLLAAAFARSPNTVATLSIVGLVATLAVLPMAGNALRGAPIAFTPLLTIDWLALVFVAVLVLGGLAVVLLCQAWLGRQAMRHAELYVLVLLATLGAAVLAAATHFASLFLGLELLSVALFAMFAYPLQARPLEAGVKYLVLSGVSSAFLLFGMALVYSATGTLELGALGAAADAGAIAIVGLALMLVGFGFKLAVVPFHMWTPDVFEGAPTPIAAFVATVSKGAVLVLLVRLFTFIELDQSRPLTLALTVIAVLSILAGNLLALLQDNVKRVLAYSSIAHLGYILIGLIALGALGTEAVAYYVVAYVVTMLAAFGVLALLEAGTTREFQRIEDLRGITWARPWLAAVFIAALLSLAGIPLTMGFVGKFYLIAAGVAAARWLPVLALIVGSAISLFYYLRIVNVMCAATTPAAAAPALAPAGGSFAGTAVLLVLTVAMVGLGIYPGPLIELIRVALAGTVP